MNKVKSSHIDSTDYDAQKRILTIKFSNGATYEYEAVPQYIKTALDLAPSKGEYFAKYIKHKFTSKKIAEGKK